MSEGDSISVTWSGNHTGIYAADRTGRLTHYGLAVGGSSLATMAERIAAVKGRNPEAVTILIGANDLTGYPSATAFLNALYAYTDPLRSLGIKVGVGTILPQYNATNPSYETTFNARRAEVNSALRTAAGKRIDGVIDFAADPEMGSNQAARNPALYSDGVHPTAGCGYGCGGQGKLATVYRTAVDRLLGL